MCVNNYCNDHLWGIQRTKQPPSQSTLDHVLQTYKYIDSRVASAWWAPCTRTESTFFFSDDSVHFPVETLQLVLLADTNHFVRRRRRAELASGPIIHVLCVQPFRRRQPQIAPQHTSLLRVQSIHLVVSPWTLVCRVFLYLAKKHLHQNTQKTIQLVTCKYSQSADISTTAAPPIRTRAAAKPDFVPSRQPELRDFSILSLVEVVLGKNNFFKRGTRLFPHLDRRLSSFSRQMVHPECTNLHLVRALFASLPLNAITSRQNDTSRNPYNKQSTSV